MAVPEVSRQQNYSDTYSAHMSAIGFQTLNIMLTPQALSATKSTLCPFFWLILETLFNSTQRALRLLLIYTLHNMTISMPNTSQNFHKCNHHTVGTVVLDVPGIKTLFLLDCEFKPIGVGSHSIREPSHYFSRSS